MDLKDTNFYFIQITLSDLQKKKGNQIVVIKHLEYLKVL